MAIILDEIKSTRVDKGTGKKVAKCSLYADTKEEVLDTINGNDIDQFEDSWDIDTGSFVMTSDFQVAQLNSSHQWIWG